MRNDPLFNPWREIAWRRKLTPEEEALLSDWLRAHPEAQADWDSEAALNDLLAGLPNVPVASNFTARVKQAVEREAIVSAQGQRRRGILPLWWRLPVTKAAMAAVLLGAGLFAYHHFKAARRAEWAQSVVTVSEVASMPSPEVLKDFDAIAALGSTPPADEELLRIMQ